MICDELLTFLDGKKDLSYLLEENEKGTVLTRKLCAKIIHLFLQKELGEKDEITTQNAMKLRDIFDCKVCAVHIAQVYEKGIMDADLVFDDDMKLFSLEHEVLRKQAEVYVKRTLDPKLRQKP